jgi:hypothetical protein
MGARNARAEVRRWVLTASRDDRAERRTNLLAGMRLPLYRGEWSSLASRFSGRYFKQKVSQS